MKYLKSSYKDWKVWWNADTVKEDRIIGAIFGAIGGAIIGCIFRIFIGEIPAPGSEFLLFAGYGFIIGVVMGALFPKPVGLVCVPFVKLLEGF